MAPDIRRGNSLEGKTLKIVMKEKIFLDNQGARKM